MIMMIMMMMMFSFEGHSWASKFVSWLSIFFKCFMIFFKRSRYLSWWSDWLVIKRLWVWILAGVASKFSSAELTFCADSYSVSVPSRVTAVTRKRPRSFCQKRRWQVTPKHAHTFDPTKSEWADYAAVRLGIVLETFRKRAHTQLIREHLATVVSARRATVDWSWPKEWH